MNPRRFILKWKQKKKQFDKSRTTLLNELHDYNPKRRRRSGETADFRQNGMQIGKKQKIERLKVTDILPLSQKFQ
ncbi:hypothetical protein EHO61_11340 [Leptospira fluminis]|uniref:Uncharacterized protein n=1 Tax=Leptospira fluminis TaxID=2484979 RepID=A0A4V6QKU4_9LEPT|nr:hypothetical protein EHO61_11340 [Leptospira fluminis]